MCVYSPNKNASVTCTHTYKHITILWGNLNSSEEFNSYTYQDKLQMALTAKVKQSQPGVVHMTAMSVLRLAAQTACATQQVPGQPGLYDSLSTIK